MPELDPFARQVVDMVRQMSDDAILDLVRKHLSVVVTPAAERTLAAQSVAKTKTKTKRPRARGDRSELLAKVETLVHRSKGVGLADVAQGVGEPKSRVQAALRDLKQAGRIAVAGDRRFTRYAADAKTARESSKRARSGA